MLLDSYDAGSHRRWREGVVAHVPADWTVLTMPPRNFSWRSTGHPLWWAREERQALAGSYDLVLAASTVDLATLRGLVPSLAKARTVVYFHENQVAYPDRRQKKNAGLAMRELYAMMAADQILLNSSFNRDSMFTGFEELFRRLPDKVPKGVLGDLKQKCIVLPVPLEDVWFQTPDAQRPTNELVILWNHRWEYDKAPERFFAALQQVKRPFSLHVAGQQFRSQPDAFSDADPDLRARAKTWGFVPSVDDYRQLLRCSHVVVSTSLHEFQGLSVLEAMASGCQALVPDRLAYKEYVPDGQRYPSWLDDPEKESFGLAYALDELSLDAPASPPEALRWSVLGPEYRALLTGS